MRSMGKTAETGSARGRRSIRTLFATALAALSVAASVQGLTAGGASAIPEYTEPNLVRTIRCDSPNPWPAPRLKIWVDVFNGIQYPADGLPGPAISLIGSGRMKPGPLEFTTDITVTWRNQRTGKTGKVRVPGRAPQLTWQVDIHPGSGPVAFTIHQKIGAMAFVPMVNPQYSTCSGRATA